MDLTDIFVIISVMFAVVGGFAFVNYVKSQLSQLDKRRRSIVFEKSEKIKKLDELNKKTIYETVSPFYHCSCVCQTKREYDYFSFDEHVVEWATPLQHLLEDAVESIEYNQRKYSEYEKQYGVLVSAVTLNQFQGLPISIKKFRQYEDEYLKKGKLLSPVLKSNVECTKTYRSRVDGSYYSDKKILSLQEVINLLKLSQLDKRRRSIVFEKSEKIKRLDKLNKQTKYESIPSVYHCSCVCQTKREYDHFSFDEHVIEWATPLRRLFEDAVESIAYNQREYSKYEKQYGGLVSTITLNQLQGLPISIEQFRQYEEEYYTKNKLSSPVLNSNVECTKTYRSQGGRHYYSDKRVFSLQEVITLLKESEESKKQCRERRSFAEQERAKMTPSLRYDILKRDGFKCQICGMSAKDNVTLHVDHIIPVSKGGKTVPSNLRTLCFTCNMGKSNKL